MSQKIVCYFFYMISKLLYFSYRFRYTGIENYYFAKNFHPKGAYCLASWHENALAGVLSQRGLPYCFLISQSKDGEYVDFLSRKFGFKTARGSSSKGGKDARLIMESLVESGYSAAFTVDGPRGPRRKCKAGVLATALNCQTAIIPFAAISKNPWIISNAWDKTRIPKPFSKILVHYGSPITISKTLTAEEFPQTLEKINDALEQTEQYAIKNFHIWSSCKSTLNVNA